MAKKKSVTKSAVQSNSFLASFDLEKILPQKYHLLAVFLVIVILFLIFLNPMYFGGKTFQSGDILTSKSLIPYVEKDRDGFSLWNPHLFLGLPAYAMGTTFPWFNIIALVFTEIRDFFTSLFSVDYTRWSFYLILLAFSSFTFMRYLTKNTLVSLFTALATAFSTGIIVFLFIGHVTKLTSLAWYPLVFLFILKFQEKIKLIDFLLLIIVLQLFIQGFHVQIIFYTLFAIGVYYIYFFLRYLVAKQKDKITSLIKSGLLLTAAIVVALLISADNFTQIWEYTPYSTRGTVGILEATQEPTTKSESDFYEYHTSWSFSPEEVMTFIIPSFYGFGNVTYKGPLSNEQDVEVNTYFGQMPFVDVAMYMGVLVFFLALFGAFAGWKDPMIRFLSILTLISLIISFGKNFSVLFDLMFYYFPYFDKFRVPSMILVLVQLSVPVLAGLGLFKIINLLREKDEKLIKVLKYTAYAAIGIFALSILLSGVVSSWFESRVADFAASLPPQRQQMAQQYNALAPFMADMFIGDMILAFAFTALFFGGSLLYLNRKISSDVLVLIAIVMVVIDLWRIDSRGARYHENPDIQAMFNKPDYVAAIESQKDTAPFRMLNLKQDGSLGSFNQNSNFNAYFLLEDFYGYSGIKPRSFQDMMDVIGPANPTLWNMANVKYIVTDAKQGIPGMTPVFSNDKTTLWKNDSVLPRLFLVDTVVTARNIDVLNMIKDNSFNPKNKAYIHEGTIKVDTPDSTAFVKITKYTDEIITADVKTTGNNFLVFSTTYIPTGWKATIDGAEAIIHRVNHGFMGITIPSGTHKVQFTYAPSSFFLTEYFVLIVSSLVILGVLLSVAPHLKKKKAFFSSEKSDAQII
ncbi:MAG TPA: YfhO family protein [Ignavibacteriaceae bacterium]|nr:YfhO family protein [Ignavibacteriaceae bacterium]